MKFETVLFDFDGTLYDSGPGIFGGIKYTADKLGLLVPEYETMRKFIGPPLRESFSKYCGLCENEAEEAVGVYREYYREKGLYEGAFYEGIKDLLVYLREKRYKLYIATLKPTEFVVTLLKKYSLYNFFEEVAGAGFDKSMDDKAKIIKYILDSGIDKNMSLMAGDSVYDIEGAKKNNISSLAVTYGYGDPDELKAAKPDYIVYSVEDIYKIV